MSEHALAMFGNLASTSASYCAFWHVAACAWLTTIALIAQITLIADARRNLFMVVLLICPAVVGGAASSGFGIRGRLCICATGKRSVSVCVVCRI
jgi:hypothetical protein